MLSFINRSQRWLTPRFTVKTVALSGLLGVVVSVSALVTGLWIFSGQLEYRVLVERIDNPVWPTYTLYLEKYHPDPNRKRMIQ